MIKLITFPSSWGKQKPNPERKQTTNEKKDVILLLYAFMEDTIRKIFPWKKLPCKLEVGDNLFCCFFHLLAVCFFYWVMLLFSTGLKWQNQFYLYNIRGRGKILNYNALGQVKLITLRKIQTLNHVRCFQTNSSFAAFFYLFMLCCFVPEMLGFYSIQSAWRLLWMDFNIILNPGNRLIIYGLIWLIKFRIGISNLSFSGIVVLGRSDISQPIAFISLLCFIFHGFYNFLLFHICFFLLFLCFSTVVWAWRTHS